MKNLTLSNIITYLTYVVTGASLTRIGLHWLRGLLTISIPYNERNPSRFWRIYSVAEDSAAYVAISLGKYARKGSGDVVIMRDSREALDKGLETVGTKDNL